MNPNSSLAQPASSNPSTNCFACAVIDEQGRETPITEAMIQQACRDLDPQKEEEEARSDQ